MYWFKNVMGNIQGMGITMYHVSLKSLQSAGSMSLTTVERTGRLTCHIEETCIIMNATMFKDGVEGKITRIKLNQALFAART